MNKKNAISIFLICCIVIFLLLVGLGITTYVSAPTPVDNPNMETPEYAYILKEYQGKIAVYQPLETTPAEVLDIYVNTLPETDVNRLEEGIVVADKEQLLSYIYDFDS